MQAAAIRPESFLPARIAQADHLPWVPLSPGKAFKPLRFFQDDCGFVELLRLEAGAGIDLHRHTGEVHVFNLQGSRRLCTGEVVGPGAYVYEPAGNVDWWKVEGDTPLVVMVVAMGAVEYLNADGQVTATYTGERLRQAYVRYCDENGIAAADLTG